MPTIIVIGGPNGAGKTTTSKSLLKDEGITAFDFDKEFYDTWKLFDFDPILESNIRESVSKKYFSAKESAILANASFAFETNYHNEEVLNTVHSFKEKSYRARLSFLILDNVEYAIERVKLRVFKGEHSVSEPTIRERFYKGLDLLNRSFHIYDQVEILRSTEGELSLLVYLNPTLKIAEIRQPVPHHLLENYLPKLKQFLVEVRQNRGPKLQ